MIVVGAIVAATVSMSDIASAAWHRPLRSHEAMYAARMPRRTFARTSFRPARLSWRHVSWRHVTAYRGTSSAPIPRAAAYAPRVAHAWRRMAMRRRAITAYQPPRLTLAGLLPFALPTPTVAAPTAGAAVAPAAAPAVYRRGAWHRVAMRRRIASAFNAVPVPAAGLAPFVAPVAAAAAAVLPASHAQMGRASFYSGGGRTAAGGHVGTATCAHRSLPFGTRVLVTNLANARSAVLTVNDRGPFVRGRIVDVSVGAAGMLGMLHSGTAPVRVQVVSR